MKYYFLQSSDGSITYCDYPIKETGSITYQFEVAEEQLALVEAGEKDFQIANGELSLINSTRKQDMEAQQAQVAQLISEKEELKSKLQNGTATDEDIKAALLKLL